MTDSAAAAAAAADYGRLLAACFYQPDPALAEEQVFDAMAVAGRALGPAFEQDAVALGEAFAGADLEGLLVDYTRLFIGPGHPLASPFESTWAGRDGASPEVPVLALYAEGGFDVADDFLNLPDHVAAQLEFLYVLLFRQVQALAAGDVDALARWEALERRLLQQHLGRWFASFAAAIRAGAQTRYFLRLADAAERFVQGRAGRSRRD